MMPTSPRTRRPNIDRMRKVNEASFETLDPPVAISFRMPDLSGFTEAMQRNGRDLAETLRHSWPHATGSY